LEGLTEEEAEKALLLLEEKGVSLGVSGLPRTYGNTAATTRLQQEQKLAESGQLLEGLEKTDPLRFYMEEVQAIPQTDWTPLVRRYAAGEDAVAQELAQLCLPMVLKQACMATGRGILLMDLIQEGNLGLWQGILHYTDGDFAEHILWWITQYLSKAIFLQARNCGVGEKLRQGMADYRDADQRLLEELGRNPTLEEIAEAIHITPQEAATYGNMISQAKLRQQVDDLQKPKEETPDDEQAVENTAYFQTRQRIAEMLSGLTEQEAKLLTLRFGLENGQPMDPQQTAQVLGMTPDEVIKLEAAALQKMRQQEQ